MLRAICLAIPMALFAACGAPKAPLSVSDSWSREALPGRNMTAAYLELTNNSENMIVIDRVTSPQFARVEIHETTMADGRMQMRRMPSLSIAPGETVELKPGGIHVMLMQPAVTLAGLAEIELSLFAQDQPLAQLTLPVARTDPYDDE